VAPVCCTDIIPQHMSASLRERERETGGCGVRGDSALAGDASVDAVGRAIRPRSEPHSSTLSVNKALQMWYQRHKASTLYCAEPSPKVPLSKRCYRVQCGCPPVRMIISCGTSTTGCGKLTSFFIWHFILKKGS
jgi:hypothetical protein